MENVIALDKILTKLTRSIDKMLVLENEKTEALIKGDVDGIDRILLAQQPLIMSVNNIEKQRLVLQEKLGQDYTSVPKMIDENFSDNAELKAKQEILTNSIKELKKVTAKNQAVLESKAGTIDNILVGFGVKDKSAVTYKK